jgi:hypothetical protein
LVRDASDYAHLARIYKDRVEFIEAANVRMIQNWIRCPYLADVEAIAERDRIAIISARSSKWALAEKMNTIEG